MSLAKLRQSQSPAYRIVPSNAYEQWYLKLGGIHSKNEMPRGKKFKAAIKRFNDGQYIKCGCVYSWASSSVPRHKYNMKNMIDELSKFD